ncbi:MAG TPA: hypothetical protein VN829_24495 [Dongiaceae bacterium]|nr:hypothetical protein [Dongiaceae bacterium]
MRILLQNFETGLYRSPNGSWTDDAEAALGFLNTLRATEHLLGRRLANTFVVVQPGFSTTAPPAANGTESRPLYARAPVRTGRTNKLKRTQAS